LLILHFKWWKNEYILLVEWESRSSARKSCLIASLFKIFSTWPSLDSNHGILSNRPANILLSYPGPMSYPAEISKFQHSNQNLLTVRKTRRLLLFYLHKIWEGDVDLV